MAEQRWDTAEEGHVYERLFPYVSSVERAQSGVFERFLRLAFLYDPHDRMGINSGWWSRDGGGPWAGPDFQVSENVCASNVDTVAALVSRNQPRARFMTDDGDWSTQRRARRLEWYAEGLCKSLDVSKVCQRAFKDAAIFGTGLVKVYADEDGQICVERIVVDEIVVDEGECRSAPPRQMHQRKLVDREVLVSRFPGREDEIRQAQQRTAASPWDLWADYRPLERDQVVVIESWRLPDVFGKGGRHVISIDGVDLLDEVWTKPFFPFARIVWSERTSGWYGIGLVERIAGHQRSLNKLNWQIDRQLDQHAVPTTYVHVADAKIGVQNTNRLGTIAAYKVRPPETVVPQAVSAEQFRRAADVKNSAYEESGVSRLSASSLKPAGLESAVALREYRDTTTERFAVQEQAYERLFLDVVWLMLDAAKDLGAGAPEVVRRSRAGSKRIRWTDVDMAEVRVQLAAASSLSRTPAGRTQTVIEWADAGIVSMDEARRLLQHPDLESAMSLYTAALEDVERCIEDLLDGEELVPEPFQNLPMVVWRGQMAYLRARADGAPEDVLENLRTWVVQAAWMVSQNAQPQLPAGPPAATPAVSALAPQPAA